jgi:tRNA threonylcarbamoyladenosine biosynthesis protein TsaB
LSYLFIDSTYDLTIGVLDDGLKWLSFDKFSGQKASAIIQSKAYEKLKELGIKSEDLKGIITIVGPGFYTGLRLAEGFADVFSFFGVKQFSFYSYEIPLWCGHDQGKWFTKAYRGEYFFHHWQGSHSTQDLVIAKEISDHITDEQFFIHSDASLDTISSSLIKNPIRTTDLLKDHPASIFPEVLKRKKREPFYFRAPEDEFKANP